MNKSRGAVIEIDCGKTDNNYAYCRKSRTAYYIRQYRKSLVVLGLLSVGSLILSAFQAYALLLAVPLSLVALYTAVVVGVLKHKYRTLGG